MTKGQLVSDIILRITKGKPSDDLELEPKQVAFWLDMFMGAMIKDNLDKKLIDKKAFIEPGYICWEKDIDLKIKNLLSDRYEFYIDLCRAPMNLYRDGAVIRVNTTDGDWVDKMKMEEIDNLNNLRWSRPSLKNIKYTRVKSRLYFYGVDFDTYLFVKFDIAYVPKNDLLETLDDDDEVFVGEDLLPAIAEEVEKLARRQTYQSGEDLENNAVQNLDGADGQ